MAGANPIRVRLLRRASPHQCGDVPGFCYLSLERQDSEQQRMQPVEALAPAPHCYPQQGHIPHNLGGVCAGGHCTGQASPVSWEG